MGNKKQTGWHDGGKDNKCYATNGQCPFGGASGYDGHFPPTEDGRKQLLEYIEKKHKLFASMDEEQKTAPANRFANADLKKFNKRYISDPNHRDGWPYSDPSVPSKKDTARNPKSSEEDLYILCNTDFDDNSGKKGKLLDDLLDNPTTPPEGLELIARFLRDSEFTNWNRTKALLEHPNCNALCADYLAESENTDRREEAAQSPKISDEMLERLMDDSHHAVRKATIWNPKITLEQLDRLASTAKSGFHGRNDPGYYDDYYVHRDLATSKRATAEILDKLSKSSDFQVITNVAQNSNTSPKTLSYLYDRWLEYKAAALEANPDEIPEVTTPLYRRFKEAILSNVNCPMKVLLAEKMNAASEDDE